MAERIEWRELAYEAWIFLRIPLGIILVLFATLVVYRMPVVLEKEKTEEAVARIHAQKLTIENVNGEHLPPPPDPTQVDATIEGIDLNANGIRDDVELAIFEKYPNDTKIRAAELQYAMALQMYLTEVFNSETWIAAVQENGRGSGCVFDSGPNVTLSDGNLKITQALKIIRGRQNEVEELVFNSVGRQQKRQEIIDRYTTSYGSEDQEDCDLGLETLSD